jgi:hypothetical protein
VLTVVNLQEGGDGAVERLTSFFGSLLAKCGQRWTPRSWDQILRPLNVGHRFLGIIPYWIEIFGIHGISDNPKLSPLADLDTLGTPCSFDSDCGASDSFCVDGECGVGAAAPQACEQEFVIVKRHGLRQGQCVAR